MLWRGVRAGTQHSALRSRGGGGPDHSTVFCVPAGVGLTAAHRAVFRPLPFPHLVASVRLPNGQINEMLMFRRLCHPTLLYVPMLVPGTYDVTLVLEHVQGVRLDLLAAPPPHGLETRQCCKLVNDCCCEFVYLCSQEPQ